MSEAILVVLFLAFTMVLMVGFLWSVIWITGFLPNVVESEHILTVEEASLIKKLSMPQVDEAICTGWICHPLLPARSSRQATRK